MNERKTICRKFDVTVMILNRHRPVLSYKCQLKVYILISYLCILYCFYCNYVSTLLARSTREKDIVDLNGTNPVM